MRITKYKTLKDSNGHASLVKDMATNYTRETSLTNPGAIVQMLCDVFEIDKQTEEYAYLLCFNTAMKLTGVLEISHGSVNCSIVQTREVFQKALLCNASNIIVAHNHPSENTNPSKSDVEVYEKLKEAGALMSIPLQDFIIVGDGYYSFKEMCS